jgi:hypothetical protein
VRSAGRQPRCCSGIGSGMARTKPTCPDATAGSTSRTPACAAVKRARQPGVQAYRKRRAAPGSVHGGEIDGERAGEAAWKPTGCLGNAVKRPRRPKPPKRASPTESTARASATDCSTRSASKRRGFAARPAVWCRIRGRCTKCRVPGSARRGCWRSGCISECATPPSDAPCAGSG